MTIFEWVQVALVSATLSMATVAVVQPKHQGIVAGIVFSICIIFTHATFKYLQGNRT